MPAISALEGEEKGNPQEFKVTLGYIASQNQPGIHNYKTITTTTTTTKTQSNR